jgi:hypothetical protein
VYYITIFPSSKTVLSAMKKTLIPGLASLVGDNLGMSLESLKLEKKVQGINY